MLFIAQDPAPPANEAVAHSTATAASLEKRPQLNLADSLHFLPRILTKPNP